MLKGISELMEYGRFCGYRCLFPRVFERDVLGKPDPLIDVGNVFFHALKLSICGASALVGYCTLGRILFKPLAWVWTRSAI